MEHPKILFYFAYNSPYSFLANTRIERVLSRFTPEIEYSSDDGTPYTVGKPDSARSFPTRRLTRPVGEWNHYYVRAINGEVRLWVNGGTQCSPSEGYLALEAEGSLVEYRNLLIRELP